VSVLTSKHLPFTVLWHKAYIFFERTSFFVSFCFSRSFYFFAENFVFVLVLVLGRGGSGFAGTLEQ
jgi:hypothetical protein